jgi:hypothetical protein
MAGENLITPALIFFVGVDWPHAISPSVPIAAIAQNAITFRV